jgi:deoxyhypusine monooxygenase
MQHPISVEALEESLRRPDEHKMVRHESTEALRAIDGRGEDVEKILIEFTHDENQVVRESCLVALDTVDYWGYSGETDETVVEDEDSNVLKSFGHQRM